MDGRAEILHIGEVLGYSYRVSSKGSVLDLGTSYRAFDMQQGNVVSLLLLSRRYGTEQQAVDRLNQSQRVIAELKHPSLVPFEQAGFAEGRFYLVREHAEGHDLAGMLARFPSLQIATAVEIALGVSEAVAAVHGAGLVHGSLSSHCIVVTGDGRVAITDIGLLPALRPDPAPVGEAWGRDPYLAPEQAVGESATPASDVYTIGLMLYQMLAGRLPTEASDESDPDRNHQHGQPPPATKFPPALVKIVDRALDPDPGARFQDAGQLADAIRLQIGPELVAAQHDWQVSGVPLQPLPYRLLVPAPPVPANSSEQSSDSRRGRHDRTPGLGRGATKRNWLMVALIVFAAIVALGLTLLGITLYRDSVAPTPTPGPVSCWVPAGVAVIDPVRLNRATADEAVWQADAQGWRRRTAENPVLSTVGSQAFRQDAYASRRGRVIGCLHGAIAQAELPYVGFAWYNSVFQGGRAASLKPRTTS